MSNQKFSQYFEGRLFFENYKTWKGSLCPNNLFRLGLGFENKKSNAFNNDPS